MPKVALGKPKVNDPKVLHIAHK